MIISIFTKNKMSEEDINKLVEVYSEVFAVVQIDNRNVILRDFNLYDVAKATSYHTYHCESLDEYLADIYAVAA